MRSEENREQRWHDILESMERDYAYFRSHYSDADLIEHFRRHYEAAMLSWDSTLDLVDDLRAEIAHLKARS